MLWRSGWGVARVGAMLCRSLGPGGSHVLEVCGTWREPCYGGQMGGGRHVVQVFGARREAEAMLQRGCHLLRLAAGDLWPRTALLQRQYRSAYSLELLYPNSKADYSRVGNGDGEQNGRSRGCTSTDIPIDRLTVTYCRSSGPGGQNVNKVNTKAEVRFHVATAEWLSEDVRNAVIAKHQNRINRAGQLIVTSEISRYQMRNLADCLQKIQDIVTAACEPPKQQSKEAAESRRMRVENMHRERLRQKRIQSSIKRDRRVEID